MRTAFEAWALQDDQIVRRREDKPDEYLIFETQRRWIIWQAALTYGKVAKKSTSRAVAPTLDSFASEAVMRNLVLNEVLDALTELDDNAAMDGILKVIQGLKKRPKLPAVVKIIAAVR